jgi:hypothetical protein
VEVNSVPLSLTIMPGRPRRATSAASSRATRRPEIEVSGIAAKHSRVVLPHVIMLPAASSTMLPGRSARLRMSMQSPGGEARSPTPRRDSPPSAPPSFQQRPRGERGETNKLWSMRAAVGKLFFWRPSAGSGCSAPISTLPATSPVVREWAAEVADETPHCLLAPSPHTPVHRVKLG